MRLNQVQRDAEISKGIAATFSAAATDRQRADYRHGWHEGFAAFEGEDATSSSSAEFRAGFEAGYAQRPTTTNQETTEISVLTNASGPCNNCGNEGYVQGSDGKYYRGCCRENGENEIAVRVVHCDDADGS